MNIIFTILGWLFGIFVISGMVILLIMGIKCALSQHKD